MDYLKILGFQINVELDCNGKNEYLINIPLYSETLKNIKNIIANKNPDIIILPEMCYHNSLKEYFKELSKNKLIIAGSTYENEQNQTIIFQENKIYKIPKCNASGSEPMVRKIQECTKEDFLKKYLKEHTFYIKGKEIVVLNCMEYYQNAYYIARENKNLFGIICICSNNNPKVFMEESRAIHNHCENIYTFMINCISTYQGLPYAPGKSYIYGPIQGHEQEWLKKDGFTLDDHCSSILLTGNEELYIYGEFTNNFSRFGRSDKYINNPRNIEVGQIRKKVLK